MDRKSKALVVLLFLFIGGALFLMYYKTFISLDYMIQSEIDCDPYTEACFVYVCNPEQETCTGDPLEDTSYYKIIRRHAATVPACDIKSETCSLECVASEIWCEYEWCDKAKEDEGVCSDPESYILENPLDETEENGLSDEESSSEVSAEEAALHGKNTASANNLVPTSE